MILDPEKRAQFEEDLEQTQNLIRSFIARNGVSIDDVDDVAQEVYIVYYKNFDKRPEDKNISAWLKGIAKNICLHYFRTKKTSKKHMESVMDILSTVQTPFNEVSHKSKAVTALKSCMQNLSEKNLKIMKLFYQDGKGYGAISRLFNTTAKTIGMTLYRIKVSLKQCIQRKIS